MGCFKEEENYYEVPHLYQIKQIHVLYTGPMLGKSGRNISAFATLVLTTHKSVSAGPVILENCITASLEYPFKSQQL